MNLQGDLKSDLNTDGRTDGRTYELVQLDSTLTAVDAHARTADRMTTVGELLTSGSIWRTGERHPVVRTGERDEIPAARPLRSVVARPWTLRALGARLHRQRRDHGTHLPAPRIQQAVPV